MFPDVVRPAGVRVPPGAPERLDTPDRRVMRSVFCVEYTVANRRPFRNLIDAMVFIGALVFLFQEIP